MKRYRAKKYIDQLLGTSPYALDFNAVSTLEKQSSEIVHQQI
jgi:hypothetical protein